MNQSLHVGTGSIGVADAVQGVRPPDRDVRGRRRFSLVVWFLLLSLLSVSSVSIIAATLLARYMTERFLQLDAHLTTEFANHLFTFEGADQAFAGSPQKPLPPAVARFFAQMGQMPDILRANIYLLDGTVFWSTEKSIVGRRFTDNTELTAALGGEPQAEIERIDERGKGEHVNLGSAGTRFVENYLPMHREGDPRQPVIAVAEVYRTPHELFESIRTGQQLVYAGAGLGTLLIVGALVSLVVSADRIIRRQKQAIAENERLATAGEMAAAVAHGLRNPLAAIRSSAELALRLRAPERTTPLLDDIVLQSDRLEHWVRQYLTAVEPDTGGRCSELTAVLANVRASLATLLERQRVSWEQSLPPDLPPVAIGGALLEQILSGIAANALQAMPAGGAIRITALASRGVVSITLADTGCGMTEEQLRHAFEPLVTSRQSGLGLGLALARRVATRHHGEITLVSEAGRGTTVSLSLPIAT